MQCAQVKFFFIARCAVDAESSDIESTSIASVVFLVINFGHLLGRIKSVCDRERRNYDSYLYYCQPRQGRWNDCSQISKSDALVCAKGQRKKNLTKFGKKMHYKFTGKKRAPLTL